MKRITLILLILIMILTYTQISSADNSYYYNGHNYTVVAANGISWNNAEAAANALGGHLAAITDAKANRANRGR